MSRRAAYFAPSVGRDFIPRRRWPDTVIVFGLYAASFAIILAVTLRHLP
ncbi:hypothetical protein [Mesorhizobium sp. M7A.F.Ca.CA.004.02.1.1]|nr:hypothetical protein [Mesorhizobium sp. M7A.F.Ca.CA.004.02.1.1]